MAAAVVAAAVVGGDGGVGVGVGGGRLAQLGIILPREYDRRYRVSFSIRTGREVPLHCLRYKSTA
jgi:hypothetical protein